MDGELDVEGELGIGRMTLADLDKVGEGPLGPWHAGITEISLGEALQSQGSSQLSRETDVTGYLYTLGIRLDETIGILICTFCEQAILGCFLKSHLKDKHDVKNKSLEGLSKALESCAHVLKDLSSLEAYLRPSSHLMRPVRGIKIHHGGFKCLLCTNVGSPVYYCAKKASLIKHHRETHLAKSTQASHETCAVQSLFRGINTKFFGVSSGDNEARKEGRSKDESKLWDSVQKLLRRFKEEDRLQDDKLRSCHGDQPRMLTLFFERVHWGWAIRDHEEGLLTALCETPPRDDPNWKGIFQGTLEYMQNVQGQFHWTSYLVLRHIKSTSSEELGSMGFSRLQESTTVTRYALVFVQLIAMLVRLVIDKSYAAILDDANLFGLEGLRSSILELWKASTSKEEDGVVVPTKLVHDVGKALFLVHRGPSESLERTCPVYRFLIWSSLSKRGGFKQIAEISPVLSMLQYWCRSVVLMEYAEWSTRERSNAVKEDLAEFNRLMLHVKEGVNTPFNALRQVIHLARAMTGEAPGMPQVYWKGEGFRSLQTIKGKSISLDDIGKTVKGLLARATGILRSEVLCGLDDPRIDKIVQGTGQERVLCDDLNSSHRGYSFLLDRDNEWLVQGCDEALIKHILCTPSLKTSFILDDPNPGQVEWNRHRLKDWFESVAEFVSLLSSLIHITAGQPSRAEELACLLLCNTPDGTPRNVYLVHGVIMLLQVYHKGRSYLSREKRIARFLPKVVTGLVLVYLLFVRPVETFLGRVLYGPGASREYQSKLLVTKGKGCDGAFISNGLKQHFLLELGVSFGVSEYRHIAIAFTEKHLLQRDALRGSIEFLDEQACHSSTTATSWYAKSNLDHRYLGRDALHAFQICSTKWHRLLGLEDSHSHQGDPVSEDTRILPTLDPPVESIPLSLACSRIECPTPRSTVSTSQLMPGDADESFSILRHLRRFYQDQTAMFKSIHQARALELILKRDQDLLVVLPTGGGKSLLFMLPAFIETKLMTVVVVPLVALTEDLLNRCVQSGISCEVWNGRFITEMGANYPSLLFVSCEIASTVTFLGALRNLVGRNRLSRIVVDECHLALIWSSFRPCMEGLIGLRTLRVPLVLLTASIPPSMEFRLKIAFGSNFTTVRRTCVRQEISYRVMVLSAKVNLTQEVVKLAIKMLANECSDPRARGIIYCRTRAETEELCETLCAQDIPASAYHGGMLEVDKTEAFRKWRSGTVRVVVATKAFGMGIDYDAVRFIIHKNHPISLLDYMQESGRCGRDGLPAVAIMVFQEEEEEEDGRKAGCNLELDEDDLLNDPEQSLSGGHSQSRKGPEDQVAMEEMLRWVRNKKECRRFLLQSVLDGSGEGTQCIYTKGYAKCDVCEEAMLKMEPEREEPIGKIGPSIIIQSMLIQDQVSHKTGRNLKRIGKLLELRGRCVVCAIMGTQGDHSLEKCRYLYGKCLRCMELGHGTRKCPHRVLFPEGVGVCYGCGMREEPTDWPEEETGHYGSGQFGEGCPWKDMVLPVSWYVWRRERAWLNDNFEAARGLRTPRDYCIWLATMTQGQCHCVHIFDLFVNKMQC